jgi:hypothetical protein
MNLPHFALIPTLMLNVPMSPDHYLIDEALADFLESDAGMLVAASDAANTPVITRGFGARVADSREQVTVFVSAQQSKPVLKDVEQTGQIAINMTRIRDYESFQLKGTNARVTSLSPKDRQHIEQYLQDITVEMVKVGLPAEVSANIFRSQGDQDLVGITFELQDVFCQTPGPGAGKAREPRA